MSVRGEITNFLPLRRKGAKNAKDFLYLFLINKSTYEVDEAYRNQTDGAKIGT